MSQKLKPKKCKLRSCRKEFQPVTEWQKFCSVQCRNVVANRERVELIRKGKRAKAQEEQEKGAA